MIKYINGIFLFGNFAQKHSINNKWSIVSLKFYTFIAIILSEARKMYFYFIFCIPTNNRSLLWLK